MESTLNFPQLRFKDGEYILKQGQTVPECFYIIQSGHVQLSSDNRFELINKKNLLGPGECFCIAAALASHVNTVTAKAEGDVVVTTVSKTNFPAFIKENLAFTTNILKYLSGRLRMLNESLTYGFEKTLDGDLDLPDSIFNAAKYYYSNKLFREAYCAAKHYLKYGEDLPNSGAAHDIVKRLDAYGREISFDWTLKDLKRTYPAGAIIFMEKEPGKEMFVIQSGSVKITKLVDDKEVVLAVLKKGDILGEMALIETKPRSASAIVVEDCEIMAIAHTAYLPILKDGASIMERICIALADRIYKTQDRILKVLVELQA